MVGPHKISNQVKKAVRCERTTSEIHPLQLILFRSTKKGNKADQFSEIILTIGGIKYINLLAQFLERSNLI